MNSVVPRLNKQALLKICVGILLLGTGPIFVKSIDVNGALIAFYRLLFASIMLTIPALMDRNQISSAYTKEKIIKWVILGGVLFATNLALWCSALNFTSASMVTLLDNTSPVWIGLFSWLFLRKQQNRFYWFGLVLAICGSFVLITSGQNGMGGKQVVGNLLGLLCGFSYAAYMLITERTRQMISSLKYTWFVSLVGATFLFIFTILTGTFQINLSIKSYFLIFLMSLSSQVIGWYFVNDAIGKLPVTASSVALVGQPLITTVLGVLILNEIPTMVQVMGGLICIMGIIIAQRSFLITNQ